MAYQHYGWSVNGQADTQMERYGLVYDGVVGTAATWDSARVKHATPPTLMETGFDFIHDDLFGDAPIQEPPSSQAVQEQQQRRAGESHYHRQGALPICIPTW
ncbi:hypothetical protein ANO14919_110660 [Xylariales sp. No.14919]|nr:hypothetical protein ANO14919_110660 [Xylariales sp. No.14919]